MIHLPINTYTAKMPPSKRRSTPYKSPPSPTFKWWENNQWAQAGAGSQPVQETITYQPALNRIAQLAALKHLEDPKGCLGELSGKEAAKFVGQQPPGQNNQRLVTQSQHNLDQRQLFGAQSEPNSPFKTDNSTKNSSGRSSINPLARNHATTFNGFQTDDPQAFHQKFGNAGPGNSRPVSKPGIRGGGGARESRHAAGNPLEGWGQVNWAKPRNRHFDSDDVPEPTVHGDGIVETSAEDIRFPPSHTPQQNPLKLGTSDGGRVFYHLLYQNTTPPFDPKNVIKAAKRARKAMGPSADPQSKITQACKSGEMKMISEGSRGTIWRVDELCPEVVGCALEMSVVRLQDGNHHRFELFGVGLKEHKDDILLISSMVHELEG
ncbi:unnamed protein product [Periconia digitata]|uniref:Uncharacterized protein n=1 Tax=Periconia digitata TaxID=1303443 RepID=A0A9W4UE45_9PLEO|nr:unnamed protein product [Periconia digitata]